MILSYLLTKHLILATIMGTKPSGNGSNVIHKPPRTHTNLSAAVSLQVHLLPPTTTILGASSNHHQSRRKIIKQERHSTKSLKCVTSFPARLNSLSNRIVPIRKWTELYPKHENLLS